MVVNVHKAKTELSKLIAKVEEGEEVIIARNGKPAVRLVLATAETPKKSGKRVLGGLRGKLKLPPDWEAQWNAMDSEIEKEFDGPIFPDEKK